MVVQWLFSSSISYLFSVDTQSFSGCFCKLEYKPATSHSATTSNDATTGNDATTSNGATTSNDATTGNDATAGNDAAARLFKQ